MNVSRPLERIIVMAPYLRGENGHHAPMCIGIAEAARKRGLSADIVIQKGGANPALIARMGAQDLLPALSIPWALPGNPARPDYRLSFRLGALFAEHARVLDPLIDDRPTLIVVDGLQPATYMGLATWLRERHADKPVGVLHLAFAFNMIDRQSGKPTSHGEVYAALLSAVDGARSDIAVFGGKYQRDFETLTGEPVSRYPMPMDLSAIPRAVAGAVRPLTLVLNPDAPGAVEAAIDCARDDFVRRHFAPRLKLASWGNLSEAQSKQLAESGVELVGRGIAAAEYAELFRAGGAMAFVYDPAVYSHATSGVMVEAAAAGLVTLVPAQTWLSDCIDERLAAGVAVDGMTGRDLVRALETAHRNWDTLAALAAERAGNMRRAHAIEPFLDHAAASFPFILGSARQYGHPVGRRLGFGDGEGAGHLFEGWSFIEPWGRWLEGERAALRLYVTPADAMPQDATLPERAPLPTVKRPVVPRHLHLEAMALLPADGPQLVDVRCNGIPIGQCRFERGAARQEFALELPPPAQVPSMHLEFHVRRPVRPSELGINKDSRRLGFGLIGLRVTEGD